MGRFLIVGKVLLNHQWAMRVIHNAKLHLNSHSVGGWILQARYLVAIWFLHTCSSERPAFFPCTEYTFPFQASFPTVIPHHAHILLINVMEIVRGAYIHSMSFFFFAWHLNKTSEGPAFPCQSFRKLLMANFPGGRNGRSSFSRLFFTKFTTQAGNTMYQLGVLVILYSAEIGYWLHISMVMQRYNTG